MANDPPADVMTLDKAEAKDHLAWVHRWPKAKVDAFVDQAFTVWERRNRVQWRYDFSPFEREFGCRLRLDDATAHRKNHQIVDEARRHRGNYYADHCKLAYSAGLEPHLDIDAKRADQRRNKRNQRYPYCQRSGEQS